MPNIRVMDIACLLQLQYVYEEALLWPGLSHDDHMELVLDLQQIDQLIEEKRNERNRDNDRPGR